MEQSFSEKVNHQIERFRRQDFLSLEAEVASKRITWVRQNHPNDPNCAPITPRRAFELLFFDYMQLPREDLPVVVETSQRITWLSRNRCATLDACKALNLDTRLICRAVFEAPTQAFLTELDPMLKFIRSYEEIRPHAIHCLESIYRVEEMIDDISSDLTILPFQQENQSEVKQLVLNGLREHWGMIDPSKNPDLDDIAASYAGASFLVAWLQKRIVGTGALVSRPDDSAEIVRMSVANNLRRRGIGKLILNQLVLRARAAGYRQVFLETTSSWQEVIEFYLRYGFHFTHYQAGDAYFALELDG
jgi:ribosomal protein S18 acetylase RimI-like enzyme